MDAEFGSDPVSRFSRDSSVGLAPGFAYFGRGTLATCTMTVTICSRLVYVSLYPIHERSFRHDSSRHATGGYGPEGSREANATNPTAPSQSSSSFAETRQQPRTRIARPRIAFSMQDPTKGEHEPKNHHRARRHRNHDHQGCPVAHGFHLGWLRH